MFISVSSEIISGSSPDPDPDRRIERQTQTAVRQTHSTKRLAISKQSKSLSALTSPISPITPVY